MEKPIAKCGCNCPECPTFKGKLKTHEDRERCSSAWEKYLGIKLSPEKLRLCDGCNIPDEDRKVYYLNCRVRKCAIRNGVVNCAYCSSYQCQDVVSIHSLQLPNARGKIEDRIGYTIPKDDYLSFVEPYEGIKHLDEIRNSLDPREIIPITPVTKKYSIIPFPEDLQLNASEISACRRIHLILSSVETGEDVSLARYEALDKNRKHILKLLWVFGLLGELQVGRKYLILDSENYSSQKITAYYKRIEEYFLILKKHGINCEISSSTNENWITPGGALKKNGWHIQLNFINTDNNLFLIKLLQKYTKLLNEKYGKNAFRYFSKADMRVLRGEK